MIVSWNWLQEYVPLDMPVDTLTERLTMAGLNLETVHARGQDWAIDLEVTSNRPDCLGHIGVAREIAVLFDVPLRVPSAIVTEHHDRTAAATAVAIECPDLCPHYVARVIRGVKVGPSPAWLRQRLEAVGVTPVNNIVDVTNYVLLECGQPLHAFDFDQLNGRRIVVRRPRSGETIEAIDHKQYALSPDMCVIADAERPVAIGGVMGGAATEISADTANLLIEVANFQPASIRHTARSLRLHSPSSYRFERGVNVQQLDWASRRCCELILETAGGELLTGPVIAGSIPAWNPPPITLRRHQIPRILGIDVPADTVSRILVKLGLEPAAPADGDTWAFRPPAWRRDLAREIDLIEEVARIHGYDRIPEDRAIPVVAATRTRRDRVVERVHQVLAAAGFSEAMTMSFVDASTAELFVPRPDAPRLEVVPKAGDYGQILRQSLVPSLVTCRRDNERQGNLNAQLYEIARVFLDATPEMPESQPIRVGLVCGGDFAEVRGLVEALALAVNRQARVHVGPSDIGQFLPGRGGAVSLNDQPWGWLGELDRDGALQDLKLRDPVSVAEIDLQPLIDAADLMPQARPIPQFPAVARDLNFVLDEEVTWEQLEAVVRTAAGKALEAVLFVDQYRGQQIPVGKKSYVLSMSFRALDRTLTGDEADAAQQAVIQACQKQLGAALR